MRFPILPIVVGVLSFRLFAFEAYVLDVGQGSAAFIKLTDHSGVLVDAGKKRADQHITKYLDSVGVDTIRAVILSHPDFDHIGGLYDVIHSGKFVINKVIKNRSSSTSKAYRKLINEINGKSIPLVIAKHDTTIDSVRIINAAMATGDANHKSLVAYYKSNGKSVIIMGDADKSTEKTMLDIKADVLVVGHHGANTTTGDIFLDSLQPEFAVISVGKNSYGHPSPELIERLDDRGVDYFRTDEKGNIDIKVENGEIVVSAVR